MDDTKVILGDCLDMLLTIKDTIVEESLYLKLS